MTNTEKKTRHMLYHFGGEDYVSFTETGKGTIIIQKHALGDMIGSPSEVAIAEARTTYKEMIDCEDWSTKW